MSSPDTLILNNTQIEQKINRIAYQIAENNYDEKDIYLVGIQGNGLLLAERLAEKLRNISHLKVNVHQLSIDKKKPHKTTVEINSDVIKFDKNIVVIVDDVANTGSTMTYALKPLMDIKPKKIQTVVLVDRKHKFFPVCIDYVGLSLATTMKERIDVVISSSGKAEAYLS